MVEVWGFQLHSWEQLLPTPCGQTSSRSLNLDTNVHTWLIPVKRNSRSTTRRASVVEMSEMRDEMYVSEHPANYIVRIHRSSVYDFDVKVEMSLFYRRIRDVSWLLCSPLSMFFYDNSNLGWSWDVSEWIQEIWRTCAWEISVLRTLDNLLLNVGEDLDRPRWRHWKVETPGCVVGSAGCGWVAS